MSRCTLDTACSVCLSVTRLSLSLACFPKTVLLDFRSLSAVRTPRCTHHGLGFSAFARRYLRNRVFFLFLRVLRCFSSPGSLLYTYVFSIRYLNITSGAFPHSDIRGSTVVCTSPQLFAAYHVLLRLLVPRHPPCALCSLIFVLTMRTDPGMKGLLQACLLKSFFIFDADEVRDEKARRASNSVLIFNIFHC